MKCKTRVQSKSYYDKHKDKKAFKLKAKANFDQWRKKNREHFNDLCREKTKLWARKKRAERKAQGLCVYCGNEILNKKASKYHCISCLDKHRIMNRAWKARKLKEQKNQ